MEYKEMKKGKMIFVGVGVDTAVSNAPKDCPAVWGKFMSNYKQIENYIGGMKNYGVSTTQNVNMCTFRYTAAAEVSELGEIPEGMETMELPESNYLIFEHRGKLDSLGQTYGKIMEFIPTTGKKQNPKHWVEFYDHRYHGDKEESVFEIWVPIKQ
jgi:AraC family transcriptional regulator